MKTKSKFLKIIVAAFVSASTLCFTAQAVPIAGEVFFNVSAGLNPADVATATSISFLSGSSVASGTGAYSGTDGATVVFHDFNFVFSPFGSPSPNLWSFTIGTNLYSMTAATLTSVLRNTVSDPQTLKLEGNGIASITGYDATPGHWTVTANSSGGRFDFSASTLVPVPDSGSTALLLGGAVSALAFFRKRHFI